MANFQRYFFHIAYKGNQYNGWQRQGNAHGVQQEIETILAKILKEPVFITGCGRTDAQVHASQYVFHTDLAPAFDFDLVYRLNRALPPDIAVFDLIPVEERAHARYDATRRTYDYFIHTRKDPFLYGQSALYAERPLDLSLMNAAIQLLPQYKDYYAFCKSPNSFEHTICYVQHAQLWTNAAGDQLRFQISANRFLTGMVRIIVGRLLEVATGVMSLEAFEYHLRERITPKNIAPAYAQGLYLSKIEYPYLQLEPRTDFAAVFRHSDPDYWHPVG